MVNKIMPLKGLKPHPKNMYVFAYSYEDFKEFCGSSCFVADRGEHSGKTICITDKYTYIMALRVVDIQGLRNIECSITRGFTINSSLQKIFDVKKEIEICNFNSIQLINPDHIPNVLREIMAENEFIISGNLIVGLVVKSTTDFPAISVKKGDKGIVVKIYGSKQDGAIVIFYNGQSSGFSKYEFHNFLSIEKVSDHLHITNYRYNSEMKLNQDYNQGEFDAEFYMLD